MRLMKADRRQLEVLLDQRRGDIPQTTWYAKCAEIGLGYTTWRRRVSRWVEAHPEMTRNECRRAALSGPPVGKQEAIKRATAAAKERSRKLREERAAK